MSYRIEYNTMEVKQEKQRKQKGKQWILGLICMAGIMTGMYVCGMEDSIKEILLPGDAKVTEAAFSDMVEDIRQGESAVTAFAGFCQEIIDHGAAE